MNLSKKKALAARTMNVGKGRIKFVDGRLDEIKEAITSQDIVGLVKKGAIEIKPVKGRLANVKRSTRKGFGKMKKKIISRKRDYVARTRKLRAYLKSLRRDGKISSEEYISLRKEIKASKYKSKSHLKENLNLKGEKHEKSIRKKKK